MAHFGTYQDLGGKWRWRLIGDNGATVASSNESFASHHNALRAAAMVKLVAAEAGVRTEVGSTLRDVLAALARRSLEQQTR